MYTCRLVVSEGGCMNEKSRCSFLCFFLLVGFTIVPGSKVEASSSVTHVYSPKSYTHYGGVTYAVKKFTYPKSVKVKLSNGRTLIVQ